MELAERAMKRGDDKSANYYISRGLRVDPDGGKLLALQVAMLEPEVGREYEPPVERQASWKPGTLLSRIKEIIEKDQLGMKKTSIRHDEEDVW